MAQGTETPTDEFGEDRAPFLPSWPVDKKSGNAHLFTGTILSVETVPDVASKLSSQVHDVDLFTVATDDGERFTMWGSGMLGRVLPAHIGHRVRIEDKGLERRDDGTQLRNFDIRCATCTAEGR